MLAKISFIFSWNSKANPVICKQFITILLVDSRTYTGSKSRSSIISPEIQRAHQKLTEEVAAILNSMLSKHWVE